MESAFQVINHVFFASPVKISLSKSFGFWQVLLVCWQMAKKSRESEPAFKLVARRPPASLAQSPLARYSILQICIQIQQKGGLQWDTIQLKGLGVPTFSSTRESRKEAKVCRDMRNYS
jgi:hypothetical protein